jgi:YggT family protein
VVIVWRVVSDVLLAVIVLMIVRLIFDYVQMFSREWRPRGAILVVLEICYSITDPPLRLLRRVLPPLRIGSFSLDMAWITLFFTVLILRSVVNSL